MKIVSQDRNTIVDSSVEVIEQNFEYISAKPCNGGVINLGTFNDEEIASDEMMRLTTALNEGQALFYVADPDGDE